MTEREKKVVDTRLLLALTQVCIIIVFFTGVGGARDYKEKKVVIE